MTLKNNPFAVFDNTLAEVGEYIEGGGYDEPDGEYVVLGETGGDLQPYSGGLAHEEYGLSVTVEKRIFCAGGDLLKAGRILKANGEEYEIVYAEPWELGTVALLKKRRDSDGD